MTRVLALIEAVSRGFPMQPRRISPLLHPSTECCRIVYLCDHGVGSASTGQNEAPVTRGPPAFRHSAHSDQNATTPSITNPSNLPPLRMSVSGKSLYRWVTYSPFSRMFGVTNQPV